MMWYWQGGRYHCRNMRTSESGCAIILIFCAKHDLPDSRQDRVRAFINKFQEKKQTLEHQKQAAHAVSLYFELLRAAEKAAPIPESISSVGQPGRLENIQQKTPMAVRESASTILRYKKISPVVPAEWVSIDQRLAEEIKMRHYSPKTLKTYALWTAKFRYFTKDKMPELLSSSDVKAYLAHLAVKCNVSASTQNQAFNALLFLFRHVLKKDFGEHRDIPRAKRTRYIPVVLSRKEKVL